MENVLAAPTAPPVAKKQWTGRILSGLVVAFLVLDAAMKLVPIAPVIEASRHLGLPVELSRHLGVLILACAVLHVIPRTRFIGALLLTAFFGGATAILVRVGDVFWFPVLMGVMLWAGLYLREPRLRALITE